MHTYINNLITINRSVSIYNHYAFANTVLDQTLQVGLFRKSGVKSRIQNLREMVEADPDGVSFENQSAFDVADMVKQYFRDLPEPIFSSKLCESFLHIYQCESNSCQNEDQ